MEISAFKWCTYHVPCTGLDLALKEKYRFLEKAMSAQRKNIETSWLKKHIQKLYEPVVLSVRLLSNITSRLYHVTYGGQHAPSENQNLFSSLTLSKID